MRHNKKFEELCLLDFYGELTPEEKVIFDQHLKGCPQCRAMKQRLENMGQKITQAPQLKPSAVLINRLNDAILDRIDTLGATSPYRKTWQERLSLWSNRLVSIMAKPRYQLATITATFILGVIVGKIWLSSGLRQHPDMLANLINYNYQLTSDERENLVKVMTGYLLRTNGIEINDLLQTEPNNGAGGIVAVNLKYSKDMAVSGGLDDPTIQSLLMYAARQDADSTRRQQAVRLLTQVPPNPGVTQTLIAVLLNEKVGATRLIAARAIQGQPAEGELLEAWKAAALRDTEIEVRQIAVKKLIDCAAEDVIPVLALVSARDSDEHIKEIAQSALEQLTLKYQKKDVRIEP